MKIRLVELFEKNKKVGQKTVTTPDNIDEITLEQAANYYQRSTKYIAEKEADEELLKKGKITEEEMNIKSVIFLADVMGCITDRPAKFFYDLDPNMLTDMAGDVGFLKDPLPTDILDKFTFRDATEDEIIIAEGEYNRIPRWKIGKRTIAKARLELMKERVFIIDPNFGYQSLRQWINSNEAAKKLTQFTDEIKEFNFTNYAKLIAEISRPKGEEYDPEKVKKRTEIFKDLPFGTTYRLGGFFLGIQSVLQRNIQTYLEDLLQQNQAQKPRKNIS